MINVVNGILAVVAVATMSLPSDTLPAPAAGRARVIGPGHQVAQPVASNGAVNSVRRQLVTRPEEAPRTPTTADFVATDVEFYLGDDGIAYIRPGLMIKINSITIGADRKPVLDVSFTDNFGNPLDRSGRITPGAIAASWVLSQWDPVTREYVPITKRNVTSPATSPTPGVTAMQAAADSGGTWTDLEMGHATYKFGTALPAGYDASATYTLGAYSTRNLNDIIGKSYYANPIRDFRPDGASVTETWAKINAATSCLNCHDELAFHGGSRREVKLCVLCHTEGVSDPDTSNSVDMEVMIHKIHNGENLENGYKVIGFQGAVHDYSHIVYPQDVRNCANCHEGTGAASTKPAQSHVWFSEPTRDACGACHDTINWTTGAGHAAGPQANDAACATCHQPDGPEFGPSIKGAHTIPAKSSQLAGLKAEIVSVSNVAPGKSPTAVFKVTNGDGSAVDPTKLAGFSALLGGPATSYTEFAYEDARAKATFDAATGNTTYTFAKVLPADAKGTWTVSADISRIAALKRADGEPDVSVREVAFNPIKYTAISGAATPRRTAVDVAKCNKCHDQLAIHSGRRKNTQECVICHNPTRTDASRRPATEGAGESISFQHMIHRIHAGENLQNEFTVWASSAHNYNEVVFPGNLANCDTCHVNGTEQLPPPISADGVLIPRGFFSPVGPGTAACLGCHDSRDAAAHAFLNTAYFPGSDQPAEACATCHGINAQWAVDKVHAD
jgi:OmcA/MtrC family decaheme c-type cytochrome